MRFWPRSTRLCKLREAAKLSLCRFTLPKAPAFLGAHRHRAFLVFQRELPVQRAPLARRGCAYQSHLSFASLFAKTQETTPPFNLPLRANAGLEIGAVTKLGLARIKKVAKRKRHRALCRVFSNRQSPLLIAQIARRAVMASWHLPKTLAAPMRILSLPKLMDMVLSVRSLPVVRSRWRFRGTRFTQSQAWRILQQKESCT